MTPTLTRRDAIAALVAGGVAGGSALALAELTDDQNGDSDLDESDVSTLVGLAEAIYPSEVTVTAEFVRTYVATLPAERREQVAEALRRLDEGAQRYTGAKFEALAPAERETVLRRMGVASARSEPSGTVPERIRYQLVNSLLYALFTSPKGSELVGIRNPTGHPGGYESLTRAPEGEDD